SLTSLLRPYRFFFRNAAAPTDVYPLSLHDALPISRWRGAADGVRCRGNTWFIPYETIQRRDRDRPHPATFPTKLPEQCLRLHGVSRIGVVMDPFTGLGSTAVACARLAIPFLRPEIHHLYLQ